jgi:hypothetical protein
LYVLSLCERTDCISRFSQDECAAVWKGVAANVAGEGRVSKAYFRVSSKVGNEIGSAELQGRPGFCGDGEKLIGLWLQ